MIELLVVIAIIGILATIVLINLNAARNKAKIAAVKAAMSELRAAGELYYDDTAGGNGDYLAFDSSNDENRIAANIVSNGGTGYSININVAGDAFCAELTLPGTGSGDWCVDTTGYVGVPTALNCTAADVTCQ